MITADGDVPAELSKLQKSYELLGELSRDEIVTAYVARDRLSGKEVAIKVLRAPDTRGREALAHYASDARMLTALEHPNIVAVHGVKWLSEDVVAVITERVHGPSLRQVLDVAGTLPVARATEVLRGLGRALAWAHSSQIMHRDVRPENVIFEDGTGRVVLSDFGLARRIDAAPGANEPGADAYRAPELADGRYPDRRSDVYSLGIVGWELLTGRRPWPDTMEPLIPGQRAPAPPPLAEVRPGLPPALVAAIEGAVQLDRDRRIPDVTTFMDRLTRVAPPVPELEEEPADDVLFALEPTEWVALPIPRMPQRPASARDEREVTREAERELADAAGRVEGEAPRSSQPKAEPRTERKVEREVGPDVAPVSAESSAPSTGPLGPLPAAGAEATPSRLSVSAPAPSPVREDATARRSKKGAPPVEPVRAERSQASVAPPVAPAHRAAPAPPSGPLPAAAHLTQTEPTQRETARAEAGTPADAKLGPARPELTRAAPAASHPARSEAARSEPARVEAAPPERTRAEPTRAEPTRAEPTRAESARSAPTPADQPRPQSGRVDGSVAGAAPFASAAAASARPGIPRAEPPSSETPPASPRDAMPAVHIPSDVELPPPEPVPFADMPAPPIRGPISGPVRGPTRVLGRFESMRGGLARPRASKGAARGRDAASGPPAPPPLQPMWDTPAEFPLPVMPDPRPMLADAGVGGAPEARRRVTRRGLAITAAALLLIVAAVTLARMQQAPDTTADLIQPETPTGYGGDVVLTPRSPDSTALTVPAPGGLPASAGQRASGGPGGRSSGGAASTPATQPTVAPPPATSTPADSAPAATGSRPAAGRRAAVTRPAPANPPAARPDSPTAAASTTPAPRGGANAARSAASAPAARPGATAGAPPRAAERRATDAGTTDARATDSRAPASRTNEPRTADARTAAPANPSARAPVGNAQCNSPALADQRACVMAHLERSDAGLNQVYADLVAAMRQRANSALGDPDPPEVQRLRAVQRAWMARRDAECRRRGRGREGPLWATPRARCLEELSVARTRELSATLARLRRD